MGWTIENAWVYEENLNSTEKFCLKKKEIKYVPGLYRLADELILNAVNNAHTTNVAININEREISVQGNGKAFPLAINRKSKEHIPTIYFGIIASEGPNSMQLCNIFSKKYTIDILSGSEAFNQVFKQNMSEKTKPKFTKNETKTNHLKITFNPDFEKFDMRGFDPDIIGLLARRAVDVRIQ